MLIRLCGHHINNPNHIDKLISIKGLPEEWLFRPSRHGGKELMPPWQPDIEANIPMHIRHLCEPVDVTFAFPPIEKGAPYVVDHRKVIGLRFDYMTEPGQELWAKIERYLDHVTPRDMKVPEPILVAPNQKSAFDPHRARRTVRGSLEFEKSDIPDIDLNKILVPTAIASIAPASITTTANVAPIVRVTNEIPAPPKEGFRCDECKTVFPKKQGLKMHNMKKHPKKEPAGV